MYFIIREIKFIWVWSCLCIFIFLRIFCRGVIKAVSYDVITALFSREIWMRITWKFCFFGKTRVSFWDRVKWWWCRLKPDFLSNSDIFLPSPYQLTPRISKRLFTPSKFSHDTDFQTDIMLNNSHDTCTHKISLWSKFLHSPSTDTFSKKKSIKFIYNIRNRNTS